MSPLTMTVPMPHRVGLAVVAGLAPPTARSASACELDESDAWQPTTNLSNSSLPSRK